MNSSIFNKIDEIIEYIQNNSEYKNYLNLKKKLSENKKVEELINKIKQNQKLMIKKQIRKESIEKLETENKLLLNELEKIPLYIDYINTQNNLNEKFQYIKNTLDDYFDQVLN